MTAMVTATVAFQIVSVLARAGKARDFEENLHSKPLNFAFVYMAVELSGCALR